MDPWENTSPSCVALTSPPQPSTGCTRTFVSCIVRTDRDSARAPLRERQTERQRGRETETDRQTERQRQRERERDGVTVCARAYPQLNVDADFFTGVLGPP